MFSLCLARVHHHLNLSVIVRGTFFELVFSVVRLQKCDVVQKKLWVEWLRHARLLLWVVWRDPEEVSRLRRWTLLSNSLQFLHRRDPNSSQFFVFSQHGSFFLLLRSLLVRIFKLLWSFLHVGELLQKVFPRSVVIFTQKLSKRKQFDHFSQIRGSSCGLYST